MLCRMIVVSVTLTCVCWAGPIDLEGLGSLLWFGPSMQARPNDMYGMWYFRELIKLCAYSFMVMVSGIVGSKGKGLA